MFNVRIETQKETKTLTLNEEQLGTYVPSFVIYQAKRNKKTQTAVVHEGKTQMWFITYLPN
jgi:hypothetical protein